MMLDTMGPMLLMLGLRIQWRELGLDDSDWASKKSGSHQEFRLDVWVSPVLLDLVIGCKLLEESHWRHRKHGLDFNYRSWISNAVLGIEEIQNPNPIIDSMFLASMD
jgi:hypothetical protein